MTNAPPVYILRETNAPKSLEQVKITKLTSRYHDVIELSIEDAQQRDLSDAIMFIVDIPLNNHQTVTALKGILQNPTTKSIASLFILDDLNRRQTVQLHSLGGADFLIHPIKPNNI